MSISHLQWNLEINENVMINCSVYSIFLGMLIYIQIICTGIDKGHRTLSYKSFSLIKSFTVLYW